jgi:hypothetical protein
MATFKGIALKSNLTGKRMQKDGRKLEEAKTRTMPEARTKGLRNL